MQGKYSSVGERSVRPTLGRKVDSFDGHNGSVRIEELVQTREVACGVRPDPDQVLMSKLQTAIKRWGDKLDKINLDKLDKLDQYLEQLDPDSFFTIKTTLARNKLMMY